MMVGHAMVAFAISAAVAARLGYDRRATLTVGVVAGLFATLPDVDMVYALFGVLQWALSATPASVGTGVWRATGAFWSSSTVVHRAVTHSLVVAVPAALAFTWAAGDRERGREIGAALLLAGLVAVSFAVSGPLGAAVMLVFALGGVALSRAAAERTHLPARARFAAAMFGLASHPFGDLFTGTPPEFLYPFHAEVVAHRIALLADPTLNLVGVFALELATICLALAVYCRLTDRVVRRYVHARSTLGVAYAIAAVILPAPTLDVSYHFVFSVLAVGLVGVTPRTRPVHRPTLDADAALAAALTAGAAIALATAAYTVAYLLF